VARDAVGRYRQHDDVVAEQLRVLVAEFGELGGAPRGAILRIERDDHHLAAERAEADRRRAGAGGVGPLRGEVGRRLAHLGRRRRGRGGGRCASGLGRRLGADAGGEREQRQGGEQGRAGGAHRGSSVWCAGFGELSHRGRDRGAARTMASAPGENQSAVSAERPEAHRPISSLPHAISDGALAHLAPDRAILPRLHRTRIASPCTSRSSTAPFETTSPGPSGWRPSSSSSFRKRKSSFARAQVDGSRYRGTARQSSRSRSSGDMRSRERS
jgi:hypothetical protein